MKPNTVFGIPEPVFRQKWVAMLWLAMSTIGKGFRKYSLRNTGKGNDRRADKLGTQGWARTSKLSRRLAAKCQVA